MALNVKNLNTIKNVAKKSAIRENGFSDPIEVTDYGMEPDKYMIVSGHRRRCAGVKEGMTKFPCIIRHFEN